MHGQKNIKLWQYVRVSAKHVYVILCLFTWNWTDENSEMRTVL